jgi:hypothetical protein
MDALEIIATLRGKGLDPILIEVGSNRVEFRLGLHIANDDEREHWSSHLSYFNLGVIVDNKKNLIMFNNVPVDDKVFAEIVGG